MSGRRPRSHQRVVPYALSPGGIYTYDGSYISTYEPVDSNTLLADDFSRGKWWTENYDDANAHGTLYGNANQLGWGGTIYASDLLAANPGAVVGGGVGLHGRQYAATSGYHDGGIGGGLMAEHNLKTQGQTEVFFRIYFQQQSDYIAGHEKMFDFTRGIGQGLVALAYNYFGGQVMAVIPYLHQDDGLTPGGTGAWIGSNVGSTVNLVTNHWYCFQHRVKLNTPGAYDGIYEWWLDDCGSDGFSQPSSPTMRGQHTAVLFRNGTTEAAVTIDGIWVENWANAPSTGTEYYANVYASKVGPIPMANPTHQP